MQYPHPILSRCGATFFALCVAFPAVALDTVVLETPGTDPALRKALENSSMILQAQTEERTAPEEMLATARAEYKRMVSVLYGQGRYGGDVSVRIDGREAADISPLSPPSSIRNIVITVKPGPEFRFSEASVKPLAPETELPDGYAKNEIAKSALIGQAAAISVESWRDAGHAKVLLADEDITANHANATIKSRLTLDPGPKLRFGPMVVRGNKRVRTERIIAIAGLPTGETYSPEELEDAAARLRRAGAFRSVSMRDAENVGPGDQITIETDVLEQKRRRIGFGAEISTQEGGRVNAFWMHRNLLGGAENLRFDLEIENIGTTSPDNGVDYRLGFLFVRPATFTPDLDLLFRGYVEREDEPGYKADTAELGFGFSYHISDTLEATFAMDYRASKVEDAFGEREYQMISFPGRLVWDTRDFEFDATKGFYVDTTLRPFVGISDMENGGQIEIDARTYWGFGEKRNTVVAGRIQFGSLFGPEISEAPQDYLFYAGGGGSVRGQPYESLGSGEVDGTIVGGRSYVALSAELRSYVKGNFGLVGFVDAGYVGAEEFYDGSGNWMTGAGLGVRYKTGFGPIRVDLATPIDGGPEDANKVQLYIGIGQAF